MIGVLRFGNFSNERFRERQNLMSVYYDFIDFVYDFEDFLRISNFGIFSISKEIILTPFFDFLHPNSFKLLYNTYKVAV